jgi:Raf kinase inhibitor-like YbhB/YbcL family protein
MKTSMVSIIVVACSLFLGGSVMAFQLTSSAFSQGAAIPAAYTGDGPDQSPPLAWTAGPDGTKSFALIVDDPEAPRGIWVHWVLYNIPSTVHSLAAGSVPKGAEGGTSSFGETKYMGPSPPPGRPHRYFFKLYALDTTLDLPAGASKEDVEEAMEDHILAMAELMGRYGR